MTQQEFYNLIGSNKINYSQSEIQELKNIIVEFPYFQLASVLNIKALYLSKDKNYRSELARTASIVTNREILFDYIYSEYNAENTKIEAKTPTKKEVEKVSIKKPISVEKAEPPKPIQNKEGVEIKTKENLMKEVSSRLEEIKKDNKTTTSSPSPGEKTKIKKTALKETQKQSVSKVKTPVKEEKKKKSAETLRKTTSKSTTNKILKPINRDSSIEILDNFIKSNPAINRPEDKDYDTEIEIAKNSIKEDYELVSETMAVLFLKQGHNEKAIKIYKKLILIYPEKSVYFAALISELNN